MVNIENIKKLRDETGVSPLEIKKALAEANNNLEKAKELLGQWGLAKAGKKAGKETKDGVIDYYIHPNAKTGVLLDIRCETDFVAKSPEFKTLAREICLHIAAMQPETVEALLESAWVKDGAKTIRNLIEDAIAKIGENIEVKRFTLYQI